MQLAIASLSSVPLGLVFTLSALLAITAFVNEFLAGLIDLSQVSVGSILDPAYLLGLRSVGGSGGLLDVFVAGPGASGGSVGRYATFILFGLVAAGSLWSLRRVWKWSLCANGNER